MVAESRTLWLWNTLPKKGIKAEDQTWRKEGDAVENVHRLELANHPKSSFGNVCSGTLPPYTVQHQLDLLGQIADLAKPGAKVEIVQVVAKIGANETADLVTGSKLASDMKLAGLTAVEEAVAIDLSNDQETVKEISEHFNLNVDDFKVVSISCKKPNFETGSSQPLSFAKKILEKKKEKEEQAKKTSAAEKKAVWNLDDFDQDDDVDFVDPDTLIDEEDLKKPDAASLRVCGTTGKRKACKDCSCGLAEELADGKEPVTKSVNSSCGSCYLGDAFRCASCPYLGMPAFKPGEKIQLSERQLKADQ